MDGAWEVLAIAMKIMYINLVVIVDIIMKIILQRKSKR